MSVLKTTPRLQLPPAFTAIDGSMRGVRTKERPYGPHILERGPPDMENFVASGFADVHSQS